MRRRSEVPRRRALEETLKLAATDLGAQGLLQRVVAPLAQAIGDLWRDGTITAAHEHFASAVIRFSSARGQSRSLERRAHPC